MNVFFKLWKPCNSAKYYKSFEKGKKLTFLFHFQNKQKPQSFGKVGALK